MAYAVLVQTKVQAEDIKALNRVGVAAVDAPNGKPFTMGALKDGVFTLAAATNADKDVWLAYSPEIVVTSGFKGIDKDPRNFVVAKGKPVDCFKPVVGDLITVTGDFFKTAPTSSKAIIELDSTGAFVGVASATSSYAGMALKLVEETHIVIASGAIGNDRVKAYTLEVTAN